MAAVTIRKVPGQFYLGVQFIFFLGPLPFLPFTLFPGHHLSPLLTGMVFLCFDFVCFATSVWVFLAELRFEDMTGQMEGFKDIVGCACFVRGVDSRWKRDGVCSCAFLIVTSRVRYSCLFCLL